MTLAEKIADATNQNLHTVALIYKAEALKTPMGDALVYVLECIDNQHIREGSLNYDNNALRYAIDLKLRKFDAVLGLT